MGQCFFLAQYKYVFSKILIRSSYVLRQSILPLLGDFFNENINFNALNVMCRKERSQPVKYS